MGYREVMLKLPTGFTPEGLRARLAEQLGLREFTCQIVTQSLDARRKRDIHWLVRVGVCAPDLEGAPPSPPPALAIEHRRRGKTALVVGSGPAGFFAADTLQRAGFETQLIERGCEVGRRARGLADFERTGRFDPTCNYAFGEGGAGTFSDGKLTSRSKHISAQRNYILHRYVAAGAPGEILYLQHPHLGTDNLRNLVVALRREFEACGGRVHFETELRDLVVADGKVVEAVTSAGVLRADLFVLATGHSAYETYRLLMRRGVRFAAKNFALGCRIEHSQELINQAQWGCSCLPGVKAAEYRLTAAAPGLPPVYSFCMCPGGTVVPATAYADANIVNGMSTYHRDGAYANAAIVAAVHPERLLRRPAEAAAVLDWLEELERRFHRAAGGHAAPACTVRDFLRGRPGAAPVATSHPLGAVGAPLWELLPDAIVPALRDALTQFGRKLRGFEQGSLLGLESKTSAPIQVQREAHGVCTGFDNLYLVGEGSGLAGGIISSAADGLRVALEIAGIPPHRDQSCG